MGDYFALLKPRVMSLVVFTALVGLLVAPVPVHPFIGFVAVLCIAVGAGASGALNMWWDADIDAKMKRTVKRPIPDGRVQPGEALGIGLALSGFSVVILWLATNALAAGLLAFTIFFYAVIYTMWRARDFCEIGLRRCWRANVDGNKWPPQHAQSCAGLYNPAGACCTGARVHIHRRACLSGDRFGHERVVPERCL